VPWWALHNEHGGSPLCLCNLFVHLARTSMTVIFVFHIPTMIYGTLMQKINKTHIKQIFLQKV
jgi:hypothetical protein